MPVGLKYGEGFGFPYRLKELTEKTSTQPINNLSALFGSGDPDAAHFVCYQALAKAGVISENTFQIHPRVLAWVGDEHVAWMQEKFGENWSTVAEFEYCLHHFPRSSLVTLAAELFLAQFITYDDFKAGYLTKEIEAIHGGTEQAAVQSVAIKHRAGKGGARASRDRRLANLESYLQEIEKLASVVGVFSEKRILDQAFESARENNPQMPKSKKSREDYETTLRSEEPFKSRYEAVFRKNA
ncbi:hypothetical protein [Falsiruegeria mediterranea]